MIYQREVLDLRVSKLWVKLKFLFDWFQSIKRYKSKLDQRLGLCIFACLTTIACILAIYGVMHKSVNDELVMYVNRTHQIAKELKHAMDENYPTDNRSTIDQNGRRWMNVEELEYDAKLIREVLFCFCVHVFLAFFFMCSIGLRWIAEYCNLDLEYDIEFQMVDRLFLYGYPRDEYQISSLQERFACEFRPHEVLVQFDLQQPCIPKIKNSLFPTYTVLLLIFIDILPFLFAFFIYAWDAWIKNSKLFRNARQRIELNNSRRVPFPKQNNYEPPPKYAPKLVEL
uniref:Innexin n=1 Tax=Angiostrongylus cantonensis TaxID=6313 RepID=A0A158P8B7_ANGCA